MTQEQAGELLKVLTGIRDQMWWLTAAVILMLLFKDMGTGRKR